MMKRVLTFGLILALACACLTPASAGTGKLSLIFLAGDGDVEESPNNIFRNISSRQYLSILNCVGVQIDGEAVISEKIRGSYQAATTDQIERNSLEATLSSFEDHYWRNDPDGLREYLAASYTGDGSTYGQDNEDFLGIHYDVTFDHVAEIETTGSTTIEIPYRPYKYDDNKWEETRYLSVTVVKENGLYKISDYQKEG